MRLRQGRLVSDSLSTPELRQIQGNRVSDLSDALYWKRALPTTRFLIDSAFSPAASTKSIRPSAPLKRAYKSSVALASMNGVHIQIH